MRTTGHEKRSKKEDVDADDKQERHSGRSRSCVSIDCANPGGADFVRRGASSLPVYGNGVANDRAVSRDRKSTRLNSSHGYISYAVFCLKKKNKNSRMIVV